MVRLQFVERPDISSRAIAWFSQGHFSHVDALRDDGTLLGSRSDSVGGKPPGVQIRPADYDSFTRKVIFTFHVEQRQEMAFWSFLVSQIGQPYDHKAIWGFVANRDWRDPSSWICSELIAGALEASGIVRPLYLDANKITPVALSLACSAAGATWV